VKKRILFVDDEPLVLAGLRRMLHGMRKEWDMEFVESGDAALCFMADKPVDVVVSDMRMPGMNGAELLNEVINRYPRTVRIILSGHADRDLIFKCVGSTHQYLSKPCDPNALRATISRALALEASLGDEGLRCLIGRIDYLPSLPSLYMKLLETINDPHASLAVVGNVIAQDIGMTATILKIVNSAFFALPREISSVNHAVDYLGLDTIKPLVLAVKFFSQFDTRELHGFSISELWNHGLHTAEAAKRIAQMESAGAKIVEEAFVSGLLHDAGKAVLAFNFPQEYSQALTDAANGQVDLLDAEQQAFGTTHANVGGYLLGLWGLPVPVVEAIARHHRPRLVDIKIFTPLTAVHVANALVHASKNSQCPPALDRQYLAALGLLDRIDFWQRELSSLNGKGV
jgi:HD-like signal output (HDOD) protein/CheY-like chemotaxis protein